MIHLNFIAGNKFDLDDFKNLEKFVDFYPDFQTVVLNNEQELYVLLQLMGIEKTGSTEINGGYFSNYWDLSNHKLPEYNEEQFAKFYMKWIDVSGRDNTMDEFGNLIFLKSISSMWNKLNYRIVLKENEKI